MLALEHLHRASRRYEVRRACVQRLGGSPDRFTLAFIGMRPEGAAQAKDLELVATSTNLIIEREQRYTISFMKLCESIGGGNRRWREGSLIGTVRTEEGACVCGFRNEANAKKAGVAAQAEVDGCCVRLETFSLSIIRLPGFTAVL